MKRTNRKGFTLIELLVVMAIILILAGLLTPGLFKAKDQAGKVNCASQLKQIGNAIEIYASQNDNMYPTAIGSLTAAPAVIDDTRVMACPVGKTAYAYANTPTNTLPSWTEIVQCTQHPNTSRVSLYKGGYVKVK